MKKVYNLFLLLIPIFIFCQTKEEFNIYSQIISENFAKNNKKIVLQKETYVLNPENQEDLKYKFLRSNYKSLELETFNNFKNANKKKSNLVNNFDKKLNVTLIEKEETNKLFRNHTGWDDFYKKYKNAIGILEFSRIGFNKNKTQAFLYYSKSSDFLNGYGNYILFEKKNGKWVKIIETMAWIS